MDSECPELHFPPTLPITSFIADPQTTNPSVCSKIKCLQNRSPSMSVLHGGTSRLLGMVKVTWHAGTHGNCCKRGAPHVAWPAAHRCTSQYHLPKPHHARNRMPYGRFVMYAHNTGKRMPKAGCSQVHLTTPPAKCTPCRRESIVRQICHVCTQHLIEKLRGRQLAGAPHSATCQMHTMSEREYRTAGLPHMHTAPEREIRKSGCSRMHPRTTPAKPTPHARKRGGSSDQHDTLNVHAQRPGRECPRFKAERCIYTFQHTAARSSTQPPIPPRKQASKIYQNWMQV
eukprot:1159412-Pelagomonas_calceolata.AAC.9